MLLDKIETKEKFGVKRQIPLEQLPKNHTGCTQNRIDQISFYTLERKIRVPGKAERGEKAENTRSM